MPTSSSAPGAGRAIVTIIGLDRVGIIAAIANILADANVNILDIRQTLMGDIFTMSMIVDMTASSRPFVEARDGLVALGREMGMEIHVQREDVFRYMHRI